MYRRYYPTNPQQPFKINANAEEIVPIKAQAEEIPAPQLPEPTSVISNDSIANSLNGFFKNIQIDDIILAAIILILLLDGDNSLDNKIMLGIAAFLFLTGII